MAIAVANSASSSASAEHLPSCGGLRTRGVIAQNTREYSLVTVITAVFNAQFYLANCLESVLHQDYPNIEHIVLDGGSRDGSVKVLQQYDNRIAFWQSEPDSGIYDAWNKGLALAHGEWICFLGADDELLPGAIAAYMALAAEHPDAEYLSSQVKWCHPSGYVNPSHGRAWKWSTFAKCMCVAHPGSMHRRSLYNRLGVYDTSYRSAADYELLLRARGSLKAAYMPIATATMRAGGASDNSAALTEAYRAKTDAGGRNPTLAALELGEAHLRFTLLPIYRFVSRLSSRFQ